MSIYLLIDKEEFDLLTEEQVNEIINVSVYEEVEDIPLFTVDDIEKYVIEGKEERCIACETIKVKKWYKKKKMLKVLYGKD